MKLRVFPPIPKIKFVKPVAIHVTHEAIQKIGGIGSVLHGLLTSKEYQKKFPISLLYTPLFYSEWSFEKRLGKKAEVLYSKRDGYCPEPWKKIFGPIEEKFGVAITYGKKHFAKEHSGENPTVANIVAVDIWQMPDTVVNAFKFKLWEEYALESDKFRQDHDYEQYLRIAICLPEILKALYGVNVPLTLFAHEYMGIPSGLSLKKGVKKFFYAHEVSTMRMVVENLPGHDLSFYNILKLDQKNGISFEETFGKYPTHSRHQLIKRIDRFDGILAVSQLIKEEILYLLPNMNPKKIHTVYNGIPIEKVPYSEKVEGRALLKEYCKNLFSFEPDFIFTHVTRLVTSKGLWRDTRLLAEVDRFLHQQKKRGVFILLSTLVGGGRPPEEIFKMEEKYGWPAEHREGWPDLIGTEIDLHHQFQFFNKKAKAIRCLFINQFGFEAHSCGKKMPPKTHLKHLRLASDIELGLSTYEPFGIAPLESIPFGGIPVVSDASGCAYLLKEILKPDEYQIVHFTTLPPAFQKKYQTKENFLKISQFERDVLETILCQKEALQTANLLPKNEKERKSRFETMQKKSHRLDWDHAAKKIILST